MAARGLAVVLTLPLVLATGVGALLCLYLRLATCDEACDASGRWWHDHAAWQWNVFLSLAAAGAAAACVLFAAVVIARIHAAVAALGVWSTCAVSLAGLLHQMGYRTQAATGWYGITLLTLFGVVSIALASGQARHETRPDG